MIATLTGKIAEKIADQVILDVNGVGYGVAVTAEDYGKLKIGQQVKVYVHEHIRENSHDLYGFTGADTKHLFEQLLEVNGVGPRMALNMLSVGNADAVRSAIASGDVKFIQAANGVGKRVAERVVVDLKDKVGLDSDASIDSLLGGAIAKKDEAVQALVALGFNPSDAVSVLSKVSKDLPVEQRVKMALKESS